MPARTPGGRDDGTALYKAYREAYNAAQNDRMVGLLERSLDHLVKGEFGASARARALVDRLRAGSEETEKE